MFYVQTASEPRLTECGDNLGDITNELRPAEYIEEFVSGHPKNYAYKIVNSTTNKTKPVCNVRGITLSYAASQPVNFVIIKDMILKGYETDRVTVHTERKIKRRRGDGRIDTVTESEDKM